MLSISAFGILKSCSASSKNCLLTCDENMPPLPPMMIFQKKLHLNFHYKIVLLVKVTCYIFLFIQGWGKSLLYYMNN